MFFFSLQQFLNEQLWELIFSKFNYSDYLKVTAGISSLSWSPEADDSSQALSSEDISPKGMWLFKQRLNGPDWETVDSGVAQGDLQCSVSELGSRLDY